MNPNTGNPVVDGVVQIAVAHLGKTSMTNEAVPIFLKTISDALVQSIQDTNAAIASMTTPAPAAKAEPAQPKTAPAPQAQETPPEARTAQPATAKSAPKVAEAKPAPAAAAPAASATVSEKTKAAPKPKPEYKFSHIPREPKIPVKDSITDDAIICLIDKEPRKMLQRHLKSRYNMTEHEYRAHFKLPHDYPMTAPGYSKEKSVMAVKQGLGTPKLVENKASKVTPAKVTKRNRSKQAATA